MFRVLSAALLLPVLLMAGCGGGGSSSSSKDAAGVRAALVRFYEDLKNEKYDAACEALTPASQALTGRGQASDCAPALQFGRSGVSSDELAALVDAAKDVEITVNGESASSAPRGTIQAIRYAYTDGHWRLELQSETGSPTAGQAKTWSERWCQAQVGMTRAQLRQLMGPPSLDIPQDSSSGDPQMSWEYAEFQFNAFMDVNDLVRQLDVNETSLSDAERAAIGCEFTRT